MTHRKAHARGKTRVPRLVLQEGRYYWKPEPAIRAAFRSQSLGLNRTEAVKAAEELNRRVDQWKASPAGRRNRTHKIRTRPSVGELIGLYKVSLEWKKLAASTQSQYAYELTRLEAEFGSTIAADLDARAVDAWWEELVGSAPETARHIASRGRVLFNWSGRKGYIGANHNPFAAMGMGSGRRRAFLFRWNDVRHLVATADTMELSSIGTALVLAFCCVQRISDVLSLTWDHIVMTPDGARLRFRQSKTGYAVNMPLPEAVMKRLGERPLEAARPLVIHEATGKRYREQTAARVFARIRTAAIKKDKAGWRHIEPCQLRDGRRSGFVHLVESGCRVELVTAWSGHSIQQGMEILEHYMPRTDAMADQVKQYMNVTL